VNCLPIRCKVTLQDLGGLAPVGGGFRKGLIQNLLDDLPLGAGQMERQRMVQDKGQNAVGVLQMPDMFGRKFHSLVLPLLSKYYDAYATRLKEKKKRGEGDCGRAIRNSRLWRGGWSQTG